MNNIDDDIFSDAKSEILFNVKQCEELFQEDKSEKLKQDIEIFKKNIQEAKQSELDFYKTLVLDDKIKESIFGIKITQQVNQRATDQKKVIVWDPQLGNLIMTKDEYEQKYGKPLMRGYQEQKKQQQQQFNINPLDQNNVFIEE